MIIIVLALIDSYAEVLRLIEIKRWGTWTTWTKSWGMNWGSKWYKIFNSFHLLPGIFKNALLLCMLSQICTKIEINWLHQLLCQYYELAVILIQVWLFWYVRNIGMHILWMRKGYKRWKYLSPVNF